MSYSVSIPEPKILEQKLARIHIGEQGVIEVFWRYNTQQAIFHVTNEASLVDPELEAETQYWFMQSDDNIMKSLSKFLPHRYYQLLAEEMVVYEDQTLAIGAPADKELENDIYNCDWSDFACDKLVLHMTLIVNTEIHSELDRTFYLSWEETCACGDVAQNAYNDEEALCEQCLNVC
jgi:hypothetical protein